MISVIYSTHRNQDYNSKFKKHLEKTIGIPEFEILEYINNNEFSLAQIYNRGISESKYNIIVCCHNDIKLENNWGKKLLDDFEKNPDFAIIGKAGSHHFPSSGVYWEKLQETMVGQVYHHPPGKQKRLSRYSAKLPFIIPVVTIDGLFISFDKTKIKNTFDETIGKFHFYDHGFCLPNFLNGVKIGVTTSFDITHESLGEPNEEFYLSKNKFVEKYKDLLPIDLFPEDIYVPKLNDFKSKNFGKIAIIIPTKGKINLLFDCISSFVEFCNPNLFEFFIADTGSSEEEKKSIKNFISEKSNVVNITLIEYDYYNFAKINNDVVKNYISDRFEFLLFCNNDIKILNDVISGMINVFNTKSRVGTVGCRLHFENNTIQHAGILIGVNKQGYFHISHLGLRSGYNFKNDVYPVIGNTAALMMIRKSTFEKIGMFNTSYIECLEDVELNLKCLTIGLENYCNSNLVAYHYESQTRKENDSIIQNFNLDYKNNMYPFLRNNYEKIKKYLVSYN